MRFTEKQLQQMQKDNKIRGYTKQRHAKESAVKMPVSNHGSKEKSWLSWNLQYWCNEHAVTLESELKFDPERNWRFDYAIPALKIAIEYEGLMSEKSGHTTIAGYSGNTEKYNRAQALGWQVYRYTVLNYKNVLTDLNKFFNHGRTN